MEERVGFIGLGVIDPVRRAAMRLATTLTGASRSVAL
jgi:hypothetical protein